MHPIKIWNSKKQLNRTLILGVVWMVIGLISIISNYKNYALSGFTVIGLLYLAIYFYHKNIPYLLIENNHLKKHAFGTQKINLADIIHFKKFAGDYIVHTKNKKLVIDTNMIDKESIPVLETFFANLNFENK